MMQTMSDAWGAVACLPIALMAGAALLARVERLPVAMAWRGFQGLALAALLAAAGAAAALAAAQGAPDALQLPPGLAATPLALMLAVLVQLLGTVIGSFSSRYLEGEAGQRRYVGSLAAVLAAVQLLLLADHWIVLIAAWALVGVGLQPLLCFYAERPFALLAAHKKRIADRAADALLVVAAALAWSEVGSGSLSALRAHVAGGELSLGLQLGAVALVLAVVLRTALLPVHGWLIQVMEAPTPVSALLHAGVVNLGGFVLIRFAPLLEQATLARTLLLAFGLVTAVLAGMVMLTRISIKVRLAWSTVAQMGFMLLECALGLYTLAALHLIGHSLYKAHAFLSASGVVREKRQQALHAGAVPSAASLVLAPVAAVLVVLGLQAAVGGAGWPAWWSVVLGLAWAPMLWLPGRAAGDDLSSRAVPLLAGLGMVAGLTAAALLAHVLPFGVQDAPHAALGLVAAAGMFALYLGLAVMQRRPRALDTWRRWSYAGFYVDEAYTRLALRLWPARWAPGPQPGAGRPASGTLLADAPR